MSFALLCLGCAFRHDLLHCLTCHPFLFRRLHLGHLCDTDQTEVPATKALMAQQQLAYLGHKVHAKLHDTKIKKGAKEQDFQDRIPACHAASLLCRQQDVPLTRLDDLEKDQGIGAEMEPSTV